MSRDLFNVRIDYGYCKYLVDDQCIRKECGAYGKYPPLKNCKPTGFCKHFVEEDGKAYEQEQPRNKA